MKKLLLATANRGKVAEIKALLDHLPLEIVSLEDYPQLQLPPETGTTFVENAVLKAEFASRASGTMALADDSGLEVEALGGEPGIYSARYAGINGDDAANNSLLLTRLEQAAPGRQARFHCALALAVPGEKTRVVEASCPGLILEAPRGEGGFGYDPLFYYPPLQRTFAQLNAAEKNRVSHRGKALRCLRCLLDERHSHPSAASPADV